MKSVLATVIDCFTEGNHETSCGRKDAEVSGITHNGRNALQATLRELDIDGAKTPFGFSTSTSEGEVELLEDKK